MRREAAKTKLIKKIENWTSAGFYGSITIAFENGIIAPEIKLQTKEILGNK